MNGGRSDASTSTDDLKGRPLCLFYFTHPFGVLSPEPPTLAGAAPHVARAFLNMRPVSPRFWPSTATEESYGRSGDTGSASARRCPLDTLGSLSSSLFSSELWFESSASSGGAEPARRALPYHRILPPLRLPSAPRDPRYSSDEDVWPRRRLPAEKFSLPPIELPAAVVERAVRGGELSPAGSGGGSSRDGRGRRRLGVDKRRRRRRTDDVRRMLACLMRRAIKGAECSPSPALQRVLSTIRAAWAEPRSLWDRCRVLSRDKERFRPDGACAMLARAQLADSSPRPDASPGLLRRRYSVPETIMRKYRLAQQRSDSEESGAVARQSAASACPSPPRDASCSPCDSPHRFVRRDRELMRKSALLRRMWARPCRAPACCCCETRSLDGSRAELRRSPAPRAAPWASPKRQRLADLSDSTLLSHRADREPSSYVDTMTEPFTDSEPSRLGSASESRASPPSSERLSEPATAEPESEPRLDRSDSDTASVSVSTAKATTGSADVPARDLSSTGHIEGRVSERSTGVENEDRNAAPPERPLAVAAPAAPYELLEIVISETTDLTSDHRAGVAPGAKSVKTLDTYERNVNIDEYVSNILVESLNSLTDQLECMNASICGDRKISIVEKEIKVKLQNTGVNTIVHLSPTSNNQIIFGNEELCNASRCARDECNNPLSIREERERSVESNNNVVSSPVMQPDAAEAALEPPLQHDNVNRAVLQQIQKLFRDELYGLEGSSRAADALPGVSHIEISNVDVYIDGHSAPGAAPRPQLEIATRDDGDLIGGIGAGNYFRDGSDAVAVPRFSAFPHTESMEVNTSSSEDADAIRSECASLVDSLDDPSSPRGALLRRRGELARSAVDVLELLPERGRGASADTRGEAFFVRIADDGRDRDTDDVRVAEYMPERIKQRLYRRHRKREQRMECARRSKVKELKKELERRRLEDAARARRELERDCVAILNALIDEVVAKVAQDEYKCMRIKRRNGKPVASKSEENLSRRTRRRDLENHSDRDGSVNENGDFRRIADKENRKSERHQVHGKLLARHSGATSDRPPRRIYQKSEIHEGEKCIEILEILEYATGSPSSPETNSDESHDRSSKCRKSRIPIPVCEKVHRTSRSETQMRLTGGDGRRASPPPGHLLASMLLQALAEEPRRAAPAPAPPEPRSRSNSLRFKRVFDIIPEERSSLSVESPAEEAAAAPPRAASPRRLRSQTTMTSPCSKSAATSPLRPPAPPPRPSREGGRERVPGGEISTPTTGAPAAGTAPPAAESVSRRRGDGSRRCSGGDSSSSSESGGSLLCPPAPRWLAGAARARRRPRRPAPPPAPPRPPSPAPHQHRGTGAGPGGWSVTVAGSCRAALPADVEMRLRFPHDSRAPHPHRPHSAAKHQQQCTCVRCASCASGRAALPPASPAAHPAPPSHDGRLTLTMKKEAHDSSILASKSLRKSSEQLPELETYRASRTKLKSSVKTRRGYSLHCWLPDDEPAPIRANNGLSVLGCAIIPELKPRAPTMSERDLTRVYTPRHYLRS